MSFDVLDDVNWLAIAAATAIYYGLAAAWFSDRLFGHAWRRSIGWEPRAGERLGLAYFIGPAGWRVCLFRRRDRYSCASAPSDRESERGRAEVEAACGRGRAL
jgi:hypothetical protein